MKHKSFLNTILLSAGIALGLTSCFNDLDTIPIDPDQVTAATVYDDPAAYQQVLAKLYAGLAVSGQQGPSGQSDIEGIDEGFGQYLRALWYHQELPTDESVIGWNDQTIKDFHEQDWDANDPFIFAFYSRIFYQISTCNEFLRETTDAKLSDRGVDEALKAEIQIYRAEARFLRALSYYHALDHFRSVPFVTEDDKVGAFFPEQINAEDLYLFIESELKAIEGTLMTPRSNAYGRADQAAAWMLLAKLYLNAEVYAGKTAWDDCVAYTQRIIDAGYVLDEEHRFLFLADNHLSTEIIFSIPFDGINTRTWGGTTFIVRAGIGGEMNAVNDFGVESGWGGTRTTSALVNKFTGSTDVRATFFTEGQNLEIADIAQFTEGYAITKFRNVNRDGSNGSNLVHVDIDFPLFRLADAYLMYAEAVLRGGNGDQSLALDYVNRVITRAYGDASGNITADELNLDFILDERARELFWEAQRRTDLIRFGQFSNGSYVWPWKGGVPEGRAVEGHFDVYPLPAADLGANPNLVQNQGY